VTLLGPFNPLLLVSDVTTDCDWPDDDWFSSLYKGYLPTLEQLDSNSDVLHHNHLRGWWLRLNYFLHSESTHSKQCLILSKSDCLSETGTIDLIKAINAKELCIALTETTLNQAKCIVEVENKKEINRGFIVPNSWGP